MPAQPDPTPASSPASTLARRLADAAGATGGRRAPETGPAPSCSAPARCGAAAAVDAWDTPTERCDLGVGHDGRCEHDPAGRGSGARGAGHDTERERDRYARLLARVEVHHGLHLAPGLSDPSAETAACRVEHWLDSLSGQR